MAEHDGSDIVRWISRAEEVELDLLIGAEYSDSNSVWSVIALDRAGLSISEEGKSPVRKPLGFFSIGTFFIPQAVSEKISLSIARTSTPLEVAIEEARSRLQAEGFATTDIGGDVKVLELASAISRHIGESIPDDNEWARLQEIITTGSPNTMRMGAKFIERWIAVAENRHPGNFDVGKRIALAVALRHSGQTEKALEASSVVDLPRGKLLGNESAIGVLCTTRAGALMDRAEVKTTNACETLALARKALNRAFAISSGNSTEVRNAYARLKSLEVRNNC